MVDIIRKNKFLTLLIPNATVFISNFCIMVLELTIGGLIAKDFGVSLHTWTAVIGVVLAGIAAGNFLGGYIADRRPAKKTIAKLFIISSILCVLISIIQNIIAKWDFMFSLPLPLHVVIHVFLICFFPAAFLGMISPIVAKMALDMKEEIGYTIGNIYAWGTFGYIIGVFVTGFILIASFGTTYIIWTVAGILGVMGLAYGVGDK